MSRFVVLVSGACLRPGWPKSGVPRGWEQDLVRPNDNNSNDNNNNYQYSM